MNISGSPARCGTETGVHDEVARRIETAGRVLTTRASLLAKRPSRAIKSFMVPTATTFSWKIQRASEADTRAARRDPRTGCDGGEPQESPDGRCHAAGAELSSGPAVLEHARLVAP